MAENGTLKQDKQMKLIDLPVVTPPPVLTKASRVTNIKQAKRLLGRLIVEFQKGLVKDQSAKTLTYMLTSFVEMGYRQDLEERISRLEGINGK